MSLSADSSPIATACDLADRFGPMPLERFDPAPFAQLAKERDVLVRRERDKRLFELIDGILVEKAVGAFEWYLTWEIMQALGAFIKAHGLGIVLPPVALLRLGPGRVRIPDISYFAWDRLPGRRVPRTSVFEISPNLAVEVTSPGNTREEMRGKLEDYFASGVDLCWYVYPDLKQVHVFTSPEACTIVESHQTLDGGDVLPGFRLDLSGLFAAGAAEG